MKVEDILAQEGSTVFSIYYEALVSEALHLLNEKRIGALVVLDASENIKGIITERDILHMYANINDQVQIKNTRVKDIMTPAEKLIIGQKSNELDYVMSIMTENRMRHLPIIDDQGKMIGFVSIGDIVKGLLKHAEYEKKLLSDYIQGTYPR